MKVIAWLRVYACVYGRFVDSLCEASVLARYETNFKIDSTSRYDKDTPAPDVGKLFQRALTRLRRNRIVSTWPYKHRLSFRQLPVRYLSITATSILPIKPLFPGYDQGCIQDTVDVCGMSQISRPRVVRQTCRIW